MVLEKFIFYDCWSLIFYGLCFFLFIYCFVCDIGYWEYEFLWIVCWLLELWWLKCLSYDVFSVLRIGYWCFELNGFRWLSFFCIFFWVCFFLCIMFEGIFYGFFWKFDLVLDGWDYLLNVFFLIESLIMVLRSW